MGEICKSQSSAVETLLLSISPPQLSSTSTPAPSVSKRTLVTSYQSCWAQQFPPPTRSAHMHTHSHPTQTDVTNYTNTDLAGISLFAPSLSLQRAFPERLHRVSEATAFAQTALSFLLRFASPEEEEGSAVRS